jgi:ribosome-binding ATPase YchF (GTP1/OBG family)
LYVANVEEADLAGQGPLVQQARAAADAAGAGLVTVCARLEAEFAELDEADRPEMLAAVGLTEPALPALRGRFIGH